MKASVLPRFVRAAALVAMACGAGLAVGADYPTTVLGLKPIVYYRLNETGNQVPADLAINKGTLGAAGNGFYLNDRGTPENDYSHPATPGALTASADAAVTFTGSGNGRGGISIPFTPALNPSAPFTVEAWVNPEAQIVDQKAFFCALNASSSGVAGVGRSGWLLYQYGDTWQFRLGDPNGYIAIAQGGLNEIGVWSHIAGVYDGTHAILYVNGIQVAKEPLGRPFHANPGQTTDIGFSSAFARNIQASIDECAIYTNVLSPAEILAHYRNGISASPAVPYDQLVLAQHPVGYWRLNEDAFTPPDPATYPIAINAGSRGTAANGVYDPGTELGQPGVPFQGFAANSRSVKFNGVSSDIQIPPLEGLITDKFSFACWILSENPGQGNPGWPGYAGLIWHQPEPAGLLGMGLDYWWDGKSLTTMWSEGMTNGYGQLSPLRPDVFVWNFVGAVWSPSNTVVYLNGQSFVIPESGPHDPHDFTQGSLFLGRVTDPGFWGFTGRMAEPAIFDRALSSAEMKSLYDAALVAPQVTTLTQSPPAPNYEGQTIELKVTAIGPAPLAYQWLKGGVPLTGKTADTLSLPNAAASDSGNYTVAVSNANGTTSSSTVAVTVAAVPPQILKDPTPAIRYFGSSVTFSVDAGGSTPIAYQWSLNGSPIPGATAASHTVPGVATANLGNYSVLLTNPHGSSNSMSAALTAVPAPGGFGAAVVAARPAAYWRFNETSGTTAFDYVGGHNGSYSGPVTNGIAGPASDIYLGLEAGNTSYSFEGNFSIVKTQPAIPINGNTLTTIALVQRGDPLKDYACILAARQAGDVAYFCSRSDGRLVYDFNDDPLSYGFEPGFIIPQDSWAFVAETVSATEAVLYIDDGGGAGLQIATNILAAPAIPVAAPVALGGDPNLNLGQDRTWNGGLDEIAYFTRTLSSTEITAIHKALITTPAPDTGPLILTASVSGNNLTLSYTKGILQSANEIAGPWTDVNGAASPSYTTQTTPGSKFFRLRN